MQPDKNIVAIMAEGNATLTKAKELAAKLKLPLINYKQVKSIPHSLPRDNATGDYFILTVLPERLELKENNSKFSKAIFVDFLAPKLNYRIKHGGSKNQLIAKACGIKNKKQLKVLDATAGLGVDAFILASLGCEVVMLERSPIISALLEDGLERFKKSQKQTVKLNLIPHMQAEDYLHQVIHNNIEKPDLIYLDPMYPQRQKSALGKKALRILHKIVGEDNDAPGLLELALECAKNRVVVKRPKGAGFLNALKPNLQFSAKGSCRYDIYFPK